MRTANLFSALSEVFGEDDHRSSVMPDSDNEAETVDRFALILDTVHPDKLLVIGQLLLSGTSLVIFVLVDQDALRILELHSLRRILLGSTPCPNRLHRTIPTESDSLGLKVIVIKAFKDRRGYIVREDALD